MNQYERNQKLSSYFLIGAVGYSLLEILWRGYTHWTMTLTGGFCFCLIYWINEKLPLLSMMKKCLLGALSITAVEFIVGLIVNKGFHLNVWDYSDQMFNLFGQVCLTFSVIWFFLCIPLFLLVLKFKTGINLLGSQAQGKSAWNFQSS